MNESSYQQEMSTEAEKAGFQIDKMLRISTSNHVSSSKETIKQITKQNGYTSSLDVASPIVAVIQDIEDGKVETREVVKALQMHDIANPRKCQLYLQLKSLIKNKDFADAPHNTCLESTSHP